MSVTEEEDRMIEGLTATEKLCFMLLDHQRRLEDRFDELITRQNYNEKWMIYYVYTRSVWGPRYHYESQWERALHLVLCKLPEERQMELLRAAFGKWADHVDAFYHMDNARTEPRNYKRIDYSAIRHVTPNWADYQQTLKELSLHDMSHRIWSMMTVEEARLYSCEFDVFEFKNINTTIVNYGDD